MTKVISEAEVSTESVEALLQQAFYKTHIDEDGDVYVMDGLDFPIWVSVDEGRKLIRFFTFARRDAEDGPPFTEASANYLNANVTLPSFYVEASRAERLCANYFLSYEDGLIDSQFIGLMRRFSGAFLYGIKQIPDHVLH